MYRALLTFFLILVVSFTTACNRLHYPRYTINSIIPRESFVKIEVSLIVKDKENPEAGAMHLGKAVASGAIVRKTSKGAYVLTAEHVCRVETPIFLVDPKFSVSGEFKALDIDNKVYDAVVYKESDKIDACILFVKLLEDRPALKLKNKPPEIGDKVYNVAAPAGFFGEQMVPIFEGRYSGAYDQHYIYTIPAMGGSSGSPVVDENGNLIGMIFAVHRQFPMISFSPSTEALYDFIKDIKKAPSAPLEREELDSL